MRAGRCAALCCALLFVGVSTCAGQEVVTAGSGQNVTLPCRAPNSSPISAAVWAKPALPEEHVFLYRDNRFDPAEQNPVFRNRVDLQDRRMKDGDVSLILKDVTVNDTGTYECRVVQRGARRSISTITLRVSPPPPPPPPPGPGGDSRNGSFGPVLHLYLPVLLLAAALVL